MTDQEYDEVGELEKENKNLRALLNDARAEFRVLASYLDAPEYNFPNAGLYMTAKAHKKMVERIDKALEN
jgi:hypothetical protein